MPWTCRLITVSPDLDDDTLQIGDMFFAPAECLVEDARVDSFLYGYTRRKRLAPWYFAHNAHRLPLIVWLPGRVAFCVDTRCVADGVVKENGWSVSGEPPLVTVTPSLNLGGVYHGYLTAGVISDDVEGRKYDQQGWLCK